MSVSLFYIRISVLHVRYSAESLKLAWIVHAFEAKR